MTHVGMTGLNILLHKIWRDLWLARQQTWLTIMSLATGLFTLGTITGMISLQLERMDQVHLASHPSHLQVLVSGDHDDDSATAIRHLPGITAVDSLQQAAVRFRKPDGQWQQGLLMVRPEPEQQAMDLSLLIQGHWPDDSSLAVENLSAAFTGLQMGDRIDIATESGIHSVAIGGMVRHPLVKPPRLGGQAVLFASRATLHAWGLDSAALRQLLIQHTPPFTLEHRDEITASLYAWLGGHHATIRSVMVQDPERHWGRPYLAGIHIILQGMALVAMLLACVLIFNILSAHMARQIRQIGILKALGTTTLRLTLTYLAEVELMAVMALLMAIPLAGIAAWLASDAVLALFNMDAGSFRFSAVALASMTACGLILPALAAVGPIWTGVRVPLTEALGSHGQEHHGQPDRLDRLVDAMAARMLPTLEASALSQCFRARSRMLMTQSVLVLSGIGFMTLLNLVSALEGTLDHELASHHYQVKLAFNQPQSMAILQSIIRKHDAAIDIEGWARHPLQILHAGQPVHATGRLGLQLMAVPAGGHLFTADIRAGRWFTSADSGQQHLVINETTATTHGLAPGDKVEAITGNNRSEWEIIGTYRSITTQPIAVEAVYAPQEAMNDGADDDKFTSLLLASAQLLDAKTEDRLISDLEALLADKGIALDSFNTIGREHLRLYALRQFQAVIMIFRGVAGMLLLVGGIGLAGTLAVQVLQRRRDIGILRSLGTPGSAIIRMVVVEALCHAVLAWIISVPLAWMLAKPMTETLGSVLLQVHLDQYMHVAGMLYWLGIVLFMAVAASVTPALQAGRISAREALDG